MSEPHNGETGQLRTLVNADRAAKLRALGREMKLQADQEIRELEAAAREQNLQDKMHQAELQAAERERQLKVQLNETRAELKDSRAQLEGSRGELENSRSQLEDSRAQLENSRAQLKMVLNSRSWKITRPLRAITGGGRSHPQEDAPSAEPPKSNDANAFETPVSSAVEPPIDPVQENTAVEVTDPLPETQDEERLSVPAAAAFNLEEDFVTRGRDAWDEVGIRKLDELLAGNCRLVFPKEAQPVISIIIVLYNKAHLGLLCMESLLANADTSYQVILVDNASTDRTGDMLNRLDNAAIIRNRENHGFGYACMQGAQKARGEYLCFLNNDALLDTASLEVVAQDFREDKEIGAIGGKILLADGRLQEAGSIVWGDGSTWGYGREDDPGLPRYNFRRPVDYCSGAFLFTPRPLFAELGGFDERFFPAYYEDADYCFKVWEKGLKVMYEPRAAIHHYESASSESAEAAKAPIARHRSRFVEKWQHRLSGQLMREGTNISRGRIAVQAGGVRVICIDASVFRNVSGPECSTPNDVFARLTAGGHHVTLALMESSVEPEEREQLGWDVELANATTDSHYLFRELVPASDVLWIRGAQNMRSFLRRMWNMYDRVPPIVYEVGVLSTEGGGENAEDEIALCEAADVVLVGSERDGQLLRERGIRNVRVSSQEDIDNLLLAVAAGTEIQAPL